jgi:hypothetical protein
MNCYYHEIKEGTHQCLHCNKVLCIECIHSEYPEYCWSCGLDHDNRVASQEKSFRFPRIFYNKYIFYLLHKLYLAFGTCFIFTVLICLVSVLFGTNEIESLIFFVGLFGGVIIYTYGIIISILIDFISKFNKRISRWYIKGCLYLMFGLIFPIIMNQNISLNQFTISIIGGVVSIIFFSFQKLKISKRAIIFFGLLSFIPIIFLIVMNQLIRALGHFEMS